jgi:hypothetical protein
MNLAQKFLHIFNHQTVYLKEATLPGNGMPGTQKEENSIITQIVL